MRRQLFSVFLLFFLPAIFYFSFAANPGATSQVQWRTYSPALFEQARKEKKMVLIYGKVSWCHWCQKMDSSTFTDPNVVQLINSRFLAVKVDIEKNSEVGGRYKIKEIPSLIILNDRDQEVKRFYGYSTPQSIMRKLTGVSNY